MDQINRRKFITTSAAVASSLATVVHVNAEEEKEEKKEPVRMAVMGVNGRGRGLISGFCKFPEVEIKYICDPDTKVVPFASKIVTDTGRPAPKVVKDFRTILDDKDWDVLVIAAPDHWHSLATILACQAGKDVYCEKPVSHNFIEGMKSVEAASKYNRVVGAGTQRRSATEIIKAVEKIHNGDIGKVNFCRAWIVSTRPTIGHEKVTTPPENLDFNLWAGPGPDDGFKKNLIPYHWHWRWDFGTGECGNNGIHALDVARWGMDVDYPRLVTCGGDKYSFDDDQETPDTQLATFDFEKGAIQWEHRTWSKRGIDGEGFGIEFYGEKHTLLIASSGWKIFDRKNKVIDEMKADAWHDREQTHLGNFLECLRTREKTNADIETCHISTSLCHLANIAWRTRSTLHFDDKTMSIKNNEAANALMKRTYRKGFELPDPV